MALINKLKAIGDAIRAKTGKTNELTLDQMVTEIEGISGGDDGAPKRDYENGWLFEIPAYVYRGVTTFANVSFPNATIIRESAFLNSFLSSIDAPLVEDVEQYAFADCNSLKTINLPKARTIGIMAFGRIGDLEYVCLPEATTIGEAAFGRCDSLKKADLPKVTSIGPDAFSGSFNLDAVIIRNTEQVAIVDVSAIIGTKLDPTRENGIEGYFYIPKIMYEYYRAGYEPAFEDLGMSGLFDILFRKIEDYPEICG